MQNTGTDDTEGKRNAEHGRYFFYQTGSLQINIEINSLKFLILLLDQSISGIKMNPGSALVASVLLLVIGRGASGVNHERPAIVQPTGLAKFKSSFIVCEFLKSSSCLWRFPLFQATQQSLPHQHRLR